VVVVAAGAADAAGAGVGATSSFFCSGLKGSSLSGPEVADIPAAGFELGISGMLSSGLGGAGVSVAVVSTGLVSASFGTSGVEV